MLNLICAKRKHHFGWALFNKKCIWQEKVQYYDIATEKRAEFDRATTEYNKKMESGEYEETDEESEYDE